MYVMSNRTTIRFKDGEREIIRKAAARFHLNYQTYLRVVILEHANHVNSLDDVGLSTLKKRPKLEMIEDDN